MNSSGKTKTAVALIVFFSTLIAGLAGCGLLDALLAVSIYKEYNRRIPATQRAE